MAKRRLLGRTLAEKLRMNVHENPETGCLLWLGGLAGQGYGAVWDGEARRTVYVHRAALAISSGESYDNPLLALHTCDNPSCFNPVHLYWGTQRQNCQDALDRGRHWTPFGKVVSTQGEHNGASILTEDAVVELRRVRRDTRLSWKMLGEKFGVSKATARAACTGRNWAYLPGACR